ncbi:hypothetical protein FJ420_31960 [Mesorhizobium sp. B3-1-3]|uniref:hypothetical protein n=1 Tax=unclassified Mesorhizobium TaxID=325217 RepID=UPI00112938B6|nr:MULTISPECIES: hypothetical protein [unclassified Mesorhizobium]TPI53303.1 hypothetical protein FJ424_32225 [Mesorhizobium sp. B3-1-8]TPI60092.1 hypothetical protein FJ420_31960 [Mesorhizobium sp. B3-1-3]
MTDNQSPIKPPQLHPRRALLRGAAEGVVELIPGAGLLTNILAVTHPPAEEADRQRWEQDISRRSNEQDELLKRVVGAFLRMQANHTRANEARQLSFVRGGMITTLEAVARDGLLPDLQVELRQKLEATATDVEDLLQGLDAALSGMSDDEKNKEFSDTLFDTVFGTFGKSTIRREIDYLLRSGNASIDEQKRIAQGICNTVDRFNDNLAKLSNYAAVSANL